MTLYFAHEPFGGFIAGDTETGLTCYAYWSSVNSGAALRDPEGTARNMLANESASLRRSCPEVTGPYDGRNWAKLAMLVL